MLTIPQIGPSYETTHVPFLIDPEQIESLSPVRADNVHEHGTPETILRTKTGAEFQVDGDVRAVAATLGVTVG